MADTATAEAPSTTARPPALQNYVRDAIRTAGMKVADLTDEQRQRAQEAPDVKGGLRGKDLGTYILEGETGLKDARAKAAANGKPKRKARAASNRYPEWVPPAVARGRHLAGQKDGSGGDETMAYAGPIQHKKVRQLVAKEILGADVDEKTGEATGWLDGITKDDIIKASGCSSLKSLREVATFKAGRDAMRPLRPLGAKFGNDGWAKGRFLAAVLVVWAEDIDKAAKSNGSDAS